MKLLDAFEQFRTALILLDSDIRGNGMHVLLHAGDISFELGDTSKPLIDLADYEDREMNKNMIGLNDYQEMALETAIYPMPIIYPALGLTGEAGEVADKVKKIIRDHNSDFSNEETRKAIALEIGDVLWYCATLSHDLGYTLEEVADMNHRKLTSRKERGKLHGSGDKR